ncbi:MAG: tetratricopeptide repeat protein [Gemmataceae bacterium]
MHALRCTVAAAFVVAAIRPVPLLAQRPPTQGELDAVVKNAAALEVAGNYKAALEQYEKATKMAEAIAGADSGTAGRLLAQQGSMLNQLGQYAKAEPILRRALKTCEAKQGPDHLDTARALSYLGTTYLATVQYAKAEPVLERGLKICESRLGPDHPETVWALGDLALVYRHTGQYAKAEPLLERALKINEAKRGPDHPDTGETLTSLASVYMYTGQNAKAEPLFQRALKICEVKKGPDHPDTAATLFFLASVHVATRQYAKAEPLLQRCLKIHESRYGPDHYTTALSLRDLAKVYVRMGQYTKAEPLLQRSLVILESRFGPDHPDTAICLDALADLYALDRKYEKAEPLYRRSLTIRESKLGPDHPETAQVLSDLAVLEGRLARAADAAAHFDRSRQAVRRHAVRTLPALPAAAQAEFLAAGERIKFPVALSFALANAGDAALAAQSAAWVVNGKANAHEANAESARAARGFDDPKLAQLAKRLSDLRGQLAALTVTTPKPGQEAARLGQFAVLGRQEAEVATELGRAGLAGLRAEPWVALDELRTALPDGAVFIDVVRFNVLKYGAVGAGENVWRSARYVAWVTPKTGPVKIVDLGLASSIDMAAAGVRKALADAPQYIRAKGEPDAEQLMRGWLDLLAKLVLHPLLPAAGGATRWVVSPDAALWLVPWDAQPLPDGRYAAEALTISYAVSGRDPVYAKQAAAAGVRPNAPLVVADPDFDAGTGTPLRPAAAAGPGNNRGLAGTLGAVQRLPGTAAEAQAVLPKLRRSADNAEPRLVTGAQASVAAVLRAVRPRSLVLSTHGYFLPDQVLATPDAPEAKLPGEKSRGPVLTAEGRPWENPLLRCGLLLAGCNRSPAAGGDTGVLTGLQVAGMDLRGCEMVVLSACETGLGDVKTGEGVAGLRQAFQLAGAQAVVATLWQVPDRESAKLMMAFFDSLAAGKPRAEALRTAQLAQIESRRQRNAASHPFFWAAYTLTGS